MLPPFIIEQIKKREEEERVRYEQPQLEVPNLPAMPRRNDAEEKDDDANRGVIILELFEL